VRKREGVLEENAHAFSINNRYTRRIILVRRILGSKLTRNRLRMRGDRHHSHNALDMLPMSSFDQLVCNSES
jgi:hypothetical protein